MCVCVTTYVLHWHQLQVITTIGREPDGAKFRSAAVILAVAALGGRAFLVCTGDLNANIYVCGSLYL